jgi:hypothetical protein
MRAVDRLVDAGEARVALEVCAAVRVRRGAALAPFVGRATSEELREYIESGRVFHERDVAMALFVGEERVRRLLHAGISHRAAFGAVRFPKQQPE